MSPVQVEISLCGTPSNAISEFFRSSQDENVDPMPRRDAQGGDGGETSPDSREVPSSSKNEESKCSPYDMRTPASVSTISWSNEFFFSSSSCVSDYGNCDDDLTSLAWLQDANLLRNMAPCSNKSYANPRRFKELTNRGVNDSSDCCSNDSCDSFRDGVCPRVDSSRGIEKPQLSFSSLIFLAIENSAEKSLPVKSIYDWITNNFPYFKDARPGWKNSIRHNLSFNRYFKNTCMDRSTKRKASRWFVDPRYRQVLQNSLLRHNSCQNDSVAWDGHTPYENEFTSNERSDDLNSEGKDHNVDLDVASTLANLSSLIGQQTGQPTLTNFRGLPRDGTRTTIADVSDPGLESASFADIKFQSDSCLSLSSPSSSEMHLEVKPELCNSKKWKEFHVGGIAKGPPTIDRRLDGSRGPDAVLNDKSRTMEGINALLGLASAVG